MLLRGWAEAARLGWEQERLEAPADHRRRYARIRSDTIRTDGLDL